MLLRDGYFQIATGWAMSMGFKNPTSLTGRWAQYWFLAGQSKEVWTLVEKILLGQAVKPNPNQLIIILPQHQPKPNTITPFVPVTYSTRNSQHN